MDKATFCLNIFNDLYVQHKEICDKEEINESDLLQNIKESYELARIKYSNDKKTENLDKYIKNAIEEDISIFLGLEEITAEEIGIEEITETESNYIVLYEEKYKNIEKSIENSEGHLTKEEIEILAAKNIPLIHSIVKRFANTGIDYSELLSAGYVGYAKALETFMKGKNVKFSTYAYRCIKNEILYFLRREKRHRDNDVSLFKPISTDKNGNVMTVDSTISTEDMGHKSVEDEVVMNETIKIMLEIIDEYLSENEAYIIKSRYGLGDTKPQTQKEIADEIGMSQANVSKLEKGINDKIKKIMSSKYKIKSI